MTECLARLPAEFDEFVKETRFMRNGATDDLVDRLQALDEAVYEDDAWQLELEDHGIDKNLVFLRSDGTSLYATRDLAHHEWKFDEYDRAVTVLARITSSRPSRSERLSSCWATRPTSSDRSSIRTSTSPKGR